MTHHLSVGVSWRLWSSWAASLRGCGASSQPFGVGLQNRLSPGVLGGQFPSERVQSWASSLDWPPRSEFPCPRSRNASPVPSPFSSVNTAMFPRWLRTATNRGNPSTARPMRSWTPWTAPPLRPASTNSSGNWPSSRRRIKPFTSGSSTPWRSPPTPRTSSPPSPRLRGSA